MKPGHVQNVPNLENDGPKTLNTRYIPMMDVYDKDVIHILLHTRANTHTDTHSEALTNTHILYAHTVDKVSDIPKEIIHCYGFPNQLTTPFSSMQACRDL